MSKGLQQYMYHNSMMTIENCVFGQSLKPYMDTPFGGGQKKIPNCQENFAIHIGLDKNDKGEDICKASDNETKIVYPNSSHPRYEYLFYSL